MDNKKKREISVLFVTGDLPPLFSGRTKNDLLLLPHCMNKGLNIEVIAPIYPKIEYDKSKEIAIKGIMTPRRFYRIFFPILTFIYMLKKRNLDLVRLRGFSFDYAILVFLIKLFLPRVKIIIQPAKYGGDDPLSIKNRKGGSFTLSQLLRADSIFSMNEMFRTEFLKVGYKKKIFLTKNPVNTEFFHPVSSTEKTTIREELFLPDKGLIISTLGILHPRKKQSFITTIFLNVLSRLNTDNVYLLHVGPKADELLNLNESKEVIRNAKLEEESIKKQLLHNKFSKNVILSGLTKVPHKFLQASDIFIHMSDSEGEANVVNEAMACGIPCIIPDSDIYSKQAPNGCAYKVNCNSTIEIENAVLKILDDYKIRRSLVKIALRNIRENRKPENVSSSYVDMIKKTYCG